MKNDEFTLDELKLAFERGRDKETYDRYEDLTIDDVVEEILLIRWDSFGEEK